MIDLIIPYYNNPKGIITTLQSINFDIFNVTIIDDGSNNYLPPTIFGAQVFRYNDNRGPGRARQWGIEHTSNPYIMFIDTGDEFTSQEVQLEIPYIIDKYSDSDIIVWSYLHDEKITNFLDNRLHGKLYKRKFLTEKGITFCPNSSYMNEDIGFNRACRLLTDNKIAFIDKPLIRQIKEENSLTQKDNKAALYRDQTRALSIVSIYTIETCIKNNVDPSLEINQIAIALYYWFIRTAAERSEYLNEAWNGARIFYNKYADQIIPNNLLLGNAKLKQCLQYRDQISFPINILRFANDIKKFENLPDNYLT